MDKVRIGMIGFGGIAREHARYIIGGEIPGVVIAAICDINPNCLEQGKNICGEKVKVFDDPDALFKSGLVDAVIITTPHYQHPPLAIAALKYGLHVLIEKPAGVYTKQVHEMNTFAAQSDKVFAIMFNCRCSPIYKKLKDIIDAGEIGDIKRTNWIITDWYRPQSYYDAGKWRATWSGEGGGVLLNQCPHQLDLWQWICGMPRRVRAFCGFGKYHDIEVEDDVTAYVEYENGATGVFIASTGEAPGSNRFEIAGDKGKIVVKNGEITFWRNRISEREFSRRFKGGFGAPECWQCQVPVDGIDEGHKGITKNWVQAILNGAPLIAPGHEGIKSLELSNAMLLSSWQDSWVDLPVDAELFYSELQQKIKNSKYQKNVSQVKIMDVAGTFRAK